MYTIDTGNNYLISITQLKLAQVVTALLVGYHSYYCYTILLDKQCCSALMKQQWLFMVLKQKKAK